MTWLTAAELDALLAAPDRTTWAGRRDHAMILLGAQTGLRASELTNLTIADLTLGTGAHVTTLGKGRRERITPLTDTTVTTITGWLKERGGTGNDPLFPTRTGSAMTGDALARRLTHYGPDAAARCPTVRGKTITPHVLRHTAAMRLLHAGIDTSVIALWLGHAETKPRRSTSTPTSRSKKQRSRRPRRSTANPAATDHRQAPRIPRSSLTPPPGRKRTSSLVRHHTYAPDMPRSPQPAISAAELDELIEQATVDCYNDSEQVTGLFTLLEEHLDMPFHTTVLRLPVTVSSVGVTTSDQIVATCQRDGHRQTLPILDLPLPDPAPDGWEWIEAYRRWLR